jgi:hypothetical protein
LCGNNIPSKAIKIGWDGFSGSKKHIAAARAVFLISGTLAQHDILYGNKSKAQVKNLYNPFAASSLFIKIKQ